MAQSISAIFAKRIRELRRERGWSQFEAAEKCGIGQKVFQHYESQVKTNPGLFTLEKIARAFGVSVPDLLTSAPPQRARRKSKN